MQNTTKVTIGLIMFNRPVVRLSVRMEDLGSHSTDFILGIYTNI